jgi:hypothetical protein
LFYSLDGLYLTPIGWKRQVSQTSRRFLNLREVALDSNRDVW